MDAVFLHYLQYMNRRATGIGERRSGNSCFHCLYTLNNDKKGKVVPLRPIEAHLGDRRYSSYSFLTSALEGGERSASRPGRALPPGKEPPVPTVQEAGWAPEPVGTQRLEENSSASVGDRTPAVQSVVRHYTDWATPAHVFYAVRVELLIVI
jgi:hypothetical protein